MNRQQLDRFLDSQIPQASLLYGECMFWIEFYSKKIASMTTDLENIVSFYFGDYDYAQVFDLLSQSSLFGDSTLVVLKIDKKLSKKELQSFLEALKKNPSNFLIVEFRKSDSKSSSEYARDFKEMAGLFKGEKLVEARFFEPNFNEAQMVLMARAKELGISIDSRHLMLLLNIQNGDLSIAYKELEKLVYFHRPIEEKDILQLCSALGSVELEDLLDALLSRREIMGIYARLEEEGLDEMGMISSIGAHFYKLFMFFAYIRSNGKADAKEILGYSPPNFVVDKMAKEAMSLREGQYREVFETLIEARVQIFSGRGKSTAVLIALQKLQKILG
ncbi:DNA polymerase III subunit delta [Helicobacter kayseriensis]|uniref:DNA polymerase III subunit delta n=1 Tax=Helicobacter kayseriensis TaxID=2905877 RepID=UPI001E44FB07|nr:DNA polymerase III subunit delta [Helicobacter kayseriensis]MCE3047218.1 DNA polymerase III subunit delta [Helicobacter kayseriensis]MCE3048589.1 DNA polymerase III subunit delta [Helicobacter kayseriensis]